MAFDDVVTILKNPLHLLTSVYFHLELNEDAGNVSQELLVADGFYANQYDSQFEETVA